MTSTSTRTPTRIPSRPATWAPPAIPRPPARRARRWRLVGLVLVAAGGSLVLSSLAPTVSALAWQVRLRSALSRGTTLEVGGTAVAPALRVVVPGTGLDAVAIPAGSFGADDAAREQALDVAPITWECGPPGVRCVAAHRDREFRHLAEVRRGALVTVTDGRAARGLRVVETRVVDPAETGFLAALPPGSVVLVTCWPPDALAPAEHRLAVVATPRLAAAPARSMISPSTRTCRVVSTHTSLPRRFSHERRSRRGSPEHDRPGSGVPAARDR